MTDFIVLSQFNRCLGAIVALEKLSERDYLSPEIKGRIIVEADELRSDLPEISDDEKTLIADEMIAYLAGYDTAGFDEGSL